MSQLELVFIELILVVFATVSALVLGDNFDVSEARLVGFTPYLVFTLATAAVVLPSLRTSRTIWRLTAIADCLRILAATAAIVIGAVALGFRFNRINGIALALPILQGLLIPSMLVGVRVVARMWHTAREQSVQLKAANQASECETVLVAGLGVLANLYLQSVAECASDRVRIAGVLGDDDRHIGRSVQGHLISGTLERIADALRDLEIHGVSVNRIVIATTVEKLSPRAQAALLEIKKTTNINLEFLVDQMRLGPRSGGKAENSSLSSGAANSVDAFSFSAEDLAALMRRPYWRVKRVLDPVVALALLVILMPFMMVTAIVAAVDVGLPVVFWQQRPGLNGRPFKLHKFRTMTAAYDAHGRRIPEEERTSDIGLLLRRTRLDELPQLCSILSGEMSFVGPRPLLPVDQPVACAARLVVRPGLTGWAQVKGGRKISAADKAALDIWYVRNASLVLDLKILVHTAAMVIFGERTDTAAIQHAWQELWQAGVCTSRKLDLERSICVPLMGARRPQEVV